MLSSSSSGTFQRMIKSSSIPRLRLLLGPNGLRILVLAVLFGQVLCAKQVSPPLLLSEYPTGPENWSSGAFQPPPLPFNTANKPIPGEDYDPNRAQDLRFAPRLTGTGTLLRLFTDGPRPEQQPLYRNTMIRQFDGDGPNPPSVQGYDPSLDGRDRAAMHWIPVVGLLETEASTSAMPQFTARPNAPREPPTNKIMIAANGVYIPPGYDSVYNRASINNPLNAGAMLPVPLAAKFMRDNEPSQRPNMFMPRWSNSQVGEPGAHLIQLQGFDFVEVDAATQTHSPTGGWRCSGCVFV